MNSNGKPTAAPPKPSASHPYNAWCLARALKGLPLELEQVQTSSVGILTCLESLHPRGADDRRRDEYWREFLDHQPDRDAVERAVAMASADGPPPALGTLKNEWYNSAGAKWLDFFTAKWLLRRGLWPVLIIPGEKRPIGEEWGIERPTEESLSRGVRDCIGRYGKRPGLGIKLGPDAGAVDFEIDGPEGEESYLKIMAGEMPDTMGWSSARGPHRIFKYDPRLARYEKSIIKVPELPGLEIRIGGEGKQLQSNCPPTVGDDGNRREWNEFDTPAELPESVFIYLDEYLLKPTVAPAPSFAVKATGANGDGVAAYAASALVAECQAVATAPEGTRNDTLNKAAHAVGTLVGAGALDESTAVSNLKVAARQCGLPDAEAARTIGSGMRAGKDKPRDLGGVRAPHKGHGRPPAGAPAPAAPGPPPQSAPAFTLVTTRAAEVKPMPVEFLVPRFIPCGKLSMLVGLGGTGKGMLWTSLAADLTAGRPAFGMSYQSPGAVEVLVIGCEEGFADTINPRLLAAGGDLSRVHRVDGVRDGKGKLMPFSLAHIEALDAYLGAHPGIALVVIDPITGYVGRAGVKDHHDAEVRSLLEPLADVADRRGTAIMASKHLNKNEAATVSSRVGGSVAYVNVPRACFVVAADPEDKGRRVLAPFKWNLNVPQPPALAWEMEQPPAEALEGILSGCGHLDDDGKARLRDQLHRLSWVGEIDVDADTLLKTAARSERKSTSGEIDRAVEWLTNRLADGPVGSIIVAREGDAHLGRTWPASDLPAEKRRVMVLGRVKWWRELVLKPKLGGESKQSGFRGPWFFRLPTHPWPPSADAGIEARKAEDTETDDAEADPLAGAFTVKATGTNGCTNHGAPTEATSTEAVRPSVSPVASVASVGERNGCTPDVNGSSTEATESTVGPLRGPASVGSASVVRERPRLMYVDGRGLVEEDPNPF